jgi:hypothetical protein
MTTPYLKIAVYARDAGPNSGTRTGVWSRITDCEDVDITLAYGTDIPVDTQSLIFRIEEKGDACTYMVFGSGDPETWGSHYGADISNLRVYGSTLDDDVTPERVMADLAAVIADDAEERDCEVTGYTIGQLCVADPTTRRQVMEDVNEMLDWNYGFEDNATFFFRQPWTAATVPDSELVVVSSADPCLRSWDVRIDRSELCNRVVCYYAKPNGYTGVVTVSESDGPLGASWKTKFLDLRDSCESVTAAGTEAQRYLDQHLWPKLTGTLTLAGDVMLANGAQIPALHIRPGMMLRNIDVDPDPHMIEHVTGRLRAREATLTLGKRASRLDIFMAREQLKAKRRAKGKR